MDGLDFAWDKPSVQAILDGGYRFVCRYLSRDTSGKNLTYDEAQTYLSNGIAVVSNWEYAADAAMNGWDQGISDARDAQSQHTACGGPVDAPIYFSVDWNVSPSQYPLVASYFGAVASEIGLHRSGAYGGYNIVNYLFNAGLIAYGWQTYAWSGGNWDGRAQLRQVQNGITVGGADCDHNVSQVDNFGQWGADMSAQAESILWAFANGLTSFTANDGSNRVFCPTQWVVDNSQMIIDTKAMVTDIQQKLDNPVPVEVDADAVAEALIANKDFIAAIATAVNDEIAVRMSSAIVAGSGSGGGGSGGGGPAPEVTAAAVPAQAAAAVPAQGASPSVAPKR